MSESKLMPWFELRARVEEIKRHAKDATTYRGLEELLSDIDAAAPAMGRLERDAEEWRQWQTSIDKAAAAVVASEEACNAD